MRGAWLCVVAGCSQFDVSRPIDVVADPSWTDVERATLAAATQCWNLQFGLQLAPTTHPDTAQTVYFDYAALACWDSWGRYLPGEPAHDSICPLGDIERAEHEPGYRAEIYAPTALLFTIAEHELGHALNIPNVSSGQPEIDSYAVMVDNNWPSFIADGFGPVPAFEAFDAAQLAAANPGFVPRKVCDVNLISDPVTTVACACATP